MEIVYLGLLSKIFNWIFDAILSPVFKFISKLLEVVLGWLFDTVLSPLLKAVLWPMFKGVLDLLYQAVASVMYSIFVQLLKIVDAMQTAFDVFSGLRKVSVGGSGEYTLIEVLFRQPNIQKAIMVITALAVFLTMGFAVLSTARSMLELDSDNQRPISRVLRSTAGAMSRFLLIPIVTLFVIMMSGQILSGVSRALNPSSTTLARMVFLVSSLDALNEKGDAAFNSSGTLGDGDSNPVEVSEKIGTEEDKYRSPYVYGTGDYSKKGDIEKTFDFGRFDYVIGYGVGLFMVIILGICLVNFICRIFEVLLLFVSSPLFVSTMPLDDGEKFKGWQDMFVAKIFGGFGSVIAMQLYMMICPIVMTGQISFVQSGSSAEANYLIRLIFLMGGAWAVLKAGPTVTQLLNYQAGMAEQENNTRAAAGMIGAATVAGSTAVSVGKAAHQKYKGYKAGRQASKEASDRRIKKTLSGNSGSGRPGTGTPGMGRPGTGTPGMGRLGTGTSGMGMSGTGMTGFGMAGTAKTKTPQPEGGSRAMNSKAGRMGTIGSKGHITVNTSKGGHRYLGADFGNALSFGRDTKGNFKARVLGVGYRTNADGKVDKISLPFVRLKKDEAGSYHVSKVKVPGVVAFKRAESVGTGADGQMIRSFGKMYCSDFKAAGVKRRFDQETGKVETLQKLGTHYGKDQITGEYVKTKTEFMGVRKEFKRDENGDYFVSHKSTWTSDQKLTKDPDGTTRMTVSKGYDGSVKYESEKHKASSGIKAEAQKEALKKLTKDHMNDD